MMTVNSMEESLEILDNGTLIARANIVDGQWRCELSGLAVGDHELTARYNESSSQSWKIKVDQIVDFDDFGNAPVGGFGTLSRPFFRLQRTAFARPPGETHSPTSIVNPGTLWISSGGSVVGRYSVSLKIDFAQSYSKISFDCLVRHQGPNSDTLSKATAFTDSGGEISSVDFVPLADNRTHIVDFEGRVKSIVFELAAVTHMKYQGEALYIDNLKMTY